jgi:hypothetical protein
MSRVNMNSAKVATGLGFIGLLLGLALAIRSLATGHRPDGFLGYAPLACFGIVAAILYLRNRPKMELVRHRARRIKFLDRR